MRKMLTSDSAKRSGRHAVRHSAGHSVTAITARLLAILIAGIIAGCGLGGKEYDETVGWSAQKLYDEAKDALNGANYTLAVKYFEKLEARYPYGRYAQQAQLEIAYAYYREGEVAQAVAACDRFIKLHPNHADVDYAFYLKGLTNFNDTQSLFAGLTREDPSERDPKGARESFDAFKELVTRFPKSKYAADATARMKFLVNALAQHEVHAARWYMRRTAYVAAVNRAQYALKTYPEAPATEEALAIMVGGYGALGIMELSDDARRVLEKNYPQSKFPGALRKDRSGWWKYWD
ncbi:MAG: outer membrane protein assembly factor BamD [Burkholderiales bacterium]